MMSEEAKIAFALAAAGLAFAGNVPYLRDMFAERIQPHAFSWMLWSLVSGITLFGQIAKGAGVGALPSAISWLFTISIFLFSLRRGFAYVTKTDAYFFVIALLGLIPWLITKDPTLSVVIAVCIDLTAFVPTVRKTWKHPHSESSALYAANVARHILALFSLEAYNIATMLHSLAMIIVNTFMVSLIIRRARNTL